MSSSGLVRPFGVSARDAQVTSNVASPDESSETLPPPSRSDPSQWALAVRVVAMRLPLSSVRFLRLSHPARTRSKRRQDPLVRRGRRRPDAGSSRPPSYGAGGVSGGGA